MSLPTTISIMERRAPRRGQSTNEPRGVLRSFCTAAQGHRSVTTFTAKRYSRMGWVEGELVAQTGTANVAGTSQRHARTSGRDGVAEMLVRALYARLTRLDCAALGITKRKGKNENDTR